MCADADENSSKTNEFIVMNRTVDWASEIELIAGPVRVTDTKESWLARAARLSASKFWHVKALYEGKLTDPKYSVAFKIVSAADRARIEEAKRDVKKVAGLYRSHAERLATIDEDFYREQIDALVSAARLLGERNNAGSGGEVK